MHYIINSMNFATTSPSLLPTQAFTPNALASLAFFQRQQIIKMLGAALANSLTAYALSLPSPVTSPLPQSSLRPMEQQSVIQILSDEEEVPVAKSGNLLLVSKNVHTLKKTAPAIKASPLLPKTVDLSPTSEEVLRESPPHSPHPSKTKPIKKAKSDRKDSDFQVEIPQLDPIETASLPAMGLSRGVLGKLRETLMRRRVSEWVYAAKKQKKEIRLLSQ